MEQEQHNPCGCSNREPLKPERKRRFSGCGILDIDPTVVKTWFRVESSAYASAQQILLNHTCMRIELTRKGKEDVFASYDAFSTDNEGNVSFYWDDEFITRPPGFYLGDVFFNEMYCFTVQFRIRRCEAVVSSCQNEHEPSCRTGCEEVIGSQSMPSTCDDKPHIPQDVIQTAQPPTFECESLPLSDCTPESCIGGVGSGIIGPSLIGLDDE